ncbi:MAG: hypothetical protein LUG23_09800 [Oscillospiraceae bacterium]|nr:hypothetical protein [Oscillospiraceae bacterium]
MILTPGMFIHTRRPWHIPPPAGLKDENVLFEAMETAEATFQNTFGIVPYALAKRGAGDLRQKLIKKIAETPMPIDEDTEEASETVDIFDGVDLINIAEEESAKIMEGIALHPHPAALRIPKPPRKIPRVPPVVALAALCYWTAAVWLRFSAVRKTPAGISGKATLTQSLPVFDEPRWSRYWNRACELLHRPDKKTSKILNF